MPSAIRSVISVAALPMSICPQAMSYLRPSSEMHLVSPVIACLVAVYGAEFGRGAYAEIEPLLMMRPPRGSCAFIIRMASCAHRNAPVRLTPTTALHCSNVRSSMGTSGAPMPALLNSRSSAAEILLHATEQRAHIVRLAHVRREPRASSPPAVFSNSAARRPAIATAYPAPCSASATARPIPLPPPVTTAILPVLLTTPELGWRGRRHPGNVADQTLQLIRDLGKVLVGAAAEFQGIVEHLGVLAEHSGLTPFDLRDHHQVVLDFLDGLLVIHDKSVPVTIYSLTWGRRSCRLLSSQRLRSPYG